MNIPDSQPLLGEWHARIFGAASSSFESGAWDARAVRSPFWRFYFNDADGHELEPLAESVAPSSPRQAEGWSRQGEAFRVPAETPVLVPAGVGFSCRSPGRVRHFYVHFDVIGPPPPALLRAFARLLALTPDPMWQARIARIRLGASESTPGLGVQLQLKSLVFDALAEAFAALSPGALDELRAGVLALSPLRRALERIEATEQSVPTNAELARLCGFSEDGFIRAFRRLSGQTPAQYGLERRLNRAAQALCFSDASIEQIAAASGFCDRFHFSRAFAARWLTTPGRFRRAQQP